VSCENGETVTVFTLVGFVADVVDADVFLKNGDCKGCTLDVKGCGMVSLATVAFLLM
jgi:hypothetical protein